jgi:PAS domain S-box-containing protein
MNSAPLPPDESSRLSTLRQYEILDTNPEEPFDNLVHLAAKICGTPIALVSLIDPLRQWFKAKVGMTACETPRNIAFCSHAILQRGIFEVPDTRIDPRFSENPLVTQDPFIWFYAGCPLVTPDGHALGTLCVIDQVPRLLTDDQRQALAILGQQVMSLMELRLRNRLLEQSRAAEIQAQRSNARLGFALDHAIDGVALLNRDGHYTYINQTHADLYEYDKAELIGESWTRLYTPEWAVKIDEEYFPILLREGRWQGEVTGRTKSGGAVQIEISLIILPEEAEHDNWLLCACSNITERKQATETIARLAERLELATSAAQIGVWDWDIVKNELVWDTRMFELYGIDNTRFGSAYDAWLAAVHPEDRARCDEAILQALRGEKSYKIEFRIIQPHGALRIIKAAGRVTWDAAGAPIRMTGTNSDITERKLAEQTLHESEERYRLMIEEISDYAIIMLNEKGDIVSWNNGARRLKQYEEAEIIGRHFSCLYQPDDIADGKPDQLLDRASAHGRAEDEGWRVRKDGSRFWANIIITARHDHAGQLRGFTKITQDITPRREAEAKLEQTTMEMECQNLELEVAHERALEATRAKSEFLASMSHEIRTPMNAIIAMADLLAETPLTKEQEGYVRRFSRAANNLLDLINDILDLSKIEAGHLELERIEFNLLELVEHTAELMAIRAHAKGLELIIDIHPEVPQTVIGDPTRLRQVLVNLAGNAIKFTEKGEIIIRVTTAEPGTIRFEVADTGIGIPEDKIPTIFDSFTQVDSSTTRKYGGTGLGLSISSQLVELMEGKIDVNSLLGMGTTFGFTVPLPVAHQSAMDAGSGLSTLQGRHILVVDDNDASRAVIGGLLSRAGASITECAKGPAAIALLRGAQAGGAPIQLVIMDQLMPEMDGFEAIEAIRQQQPFAEIPVLMLLSKMHSDSARMQRLGIKAEVNKPITRASLLSAIAEANAGSTAPAQATRPQTASPPQAFDAPTPALRILVAEDLEDNRDVVALFLSKSPYSLDFAENGAIAVSKFQAGRYDLVLMDMQMPILDGYQATEAIRRWEQDQQRTPTPILALTANAFIEEINRGLAAGCTAHLTKPIKKQVLLNAILEHTKHITEQAA